MGDIIKVLIVDDEYLIRNLINMKIKWKEIGMEFVGEAGSAREALELVDQFLPDIILTDICMPSMDGIEFSKIVIEKYPHIKIAVITGYDEFEYARSSVKLGIDDFILKPIHSDELMETLYKLKDNILSERTHIEEYNKLKQQLDENLPFLKEKFLNELLTEQLSSEEVVKKFNYFKIPINPNYNIFQVALLEAEDFVNDEEKEENKILLSMQCLNIICDYFRDVRYIFVFLDNRRRVVILLNNPNIDLIESCEAIQMNLIKKLNCSINFGIGLRQEGIYNIRFSYEEAEDAVNYMVLVGKNQVVSYEDIHFTMDKPYHTDVDGIQKLKMFMNVGARENALDILEQLLTISCYDSMEIITKIRLKAFDIYSACQHLISEQNMDIDEIWNHEVKINDLILKVDNLPELKSYMREFVGTITDKIQKLNNTKTHTLIEQVKEYLNNNISNPDLSPSSVSKEFYISSGHLGRLFKQETSKTFVEYLTEIRMNKARKLLKESDLKGYEVGEKVGIYNPHYFSILFKKHTGLSINEFRKI